MEKERVIIFGLGGLWEKYKFDIEKQFTVMAYTDNNEENKNKLKNKEKFILPEDINNHEYDKIIICSSFYKEIQKQLVDSLKVSKEKIGGINYTLGIEIIKTSISDNGRYPDLCFRASVDSEYFNSFKREPVYTEVLEHATEEQGRKYLEHIKEFSPHLLEKIDTFKDNDSYGNPILYKYEGIGYISPTTLRYIKVLSDLENQFGNLDDKEICEIGVGYGGQCRIICSYYKVKSYTLIDLPQVLSLAKTYLNNYCLDGKLSYLTMNELDRKQKYDVFLSNYAFSELRYDIQECYYYKTIANSASGYITYNNIGNELVKQFTLKDYSEKISHLNIYEEKPETYIGNKILVWKNV